MTLTGLVKDLIGGALATSGPSERGELEALRSQLDEPLRVAVAGRVSSGKSTLINALLGRRVAPTAETETTRVVAHFKSGHPERIDAVLASGERVPCEFVGGMLPRELHLSEPVAALEVTLSVESGVLEWMTLIDTPGFGGLTIGNEVTRAAMRSADAMILLVNEALLIDELDVVKEFERSSQHVGSAARTLGVLSRADELGGADQWVTASGLAADHVRRAGGALSEVFPLMGLLAETAETGALAQADVDALVRLSECEESALQLALLSPDLFVEGRDLPLDMQARARLVQLLRPSGIKQALHVIRQGDAAVRTAPGLRRVLRAHSGFARVREALIDDLGRRSDAVKARRAVERLRSMAFARSEAGGDSGRRLQRLLERMVREPGWNELSLVEGLAKVRAHKVSLRADYELDLRRMVQGKALDDRLGTSGADPADLRQAIVAGNTRWAQLAVAGTQGQVEIADSMRRAYTSAMLDLEQRLGTDEAVAHGAR